jgi:hypothetical protein
MPQLPVFLQLSAEEPESPFSHMRFNTTNHGKLLVFSTGNVIRAGKYTHCDAVGCLLAFFRWARGQDSVLNAMWPAAISTPNAVLTGQFVSPINPSFKHHAKATCSNRFPGISVQLPEQAGGDRVTPELFLKDSKWILPGVRSAPGAFNALAELVDIVHGDNQ